MQASNKGIAFNDGRSCPTTAGAFCSTTETRKPRL